MSQGGGKNNIPDWLCQMSGWEDAPEWLISLIEQAEGPLSFEDLGGSMEEMGFDASEVFSSQERSKPKESPALAGVETEAADWFSGLEEPQEGEAAPETDVQEEGAPDRMTGLGEDIPAPTAPAEAADVQGAQGAGEADWLSGLEDLPPIDESEEADWMEDLDTGEPEEEPVEPEEDLPDWLSGLGADVPVGTAEGTTLDAGGVPDWLSGLDTGAPTDVSKETAPTVMEGVPDWLSGLEAGAPTDVSAEEAPSPAAPVAEDEGAPDWLSGLGADVPADVSAEAPEMAPAPAAPAVADEGALDWLSGLGADVPADVSAEAPEEAPSPAAPAVADEGALDWLSGLGADVPADVSAEAPEEAPSPAAPAVADEGALDWLSGLGADVPADVSAEAPEEAPAPAAPVAEDEGAPDWLSGLGADVPADVSAEAPEEAPAPAAPVAEDEGAPDWLSRLDIGAPADVSAEETSPVADEGAPDWLNGLGADAPADVSAEAPDAVADEGAPDWLTGLRADVSADVSAEAPEEEASVAAAEQEAVPGWQSDLDTGQLGDALEEAAPTDAGGVPGREVRFATSMLDDLSVEAVPPETVVPTAADAQEAVPDWLGGLDVGETIEEAPTEVAAVEATGGLDAGIPEWLSDLDTGAPAETAEAAAPGIPTDAQVAPEEGVPDWLAAIDMSLPRAEAADEAPVAEPVPAAVPDMPEAEGGLPDWLADVEADVPDEAQETPFVEEEPDRPTIAAEEIPAVQPVEQAVVDSPEKVPAQETEDIDWLQDMGEVATGPQPATRKGVTAWLTEVQDMPVPEEDVSEEGPEQEPEAMPGWLQDLDAGAASEEEAAAEPSIPMEMPDWLREVPADASPTPIELAPTEPSLPPEDTSMPSWMEDMRVPEQETTSIDDVLGLSVQEGMTTVETPAWVAELRDQEPETPVEELPIETSGPLAGLRGVLNPEPLLAILPKSAYRPMLPVPDSHQAEAQLVEQALEPVSQLTSLSRSHGRQVMASLGRWLMYIALLAMMVVSPLRGAVVPVDLLETQSFINTINALPDGSEVLLVIDYDASLDGELTPQTRAIVWHLLQKNLGIVTVSFTPQGLAIARDLFLEKETVVQGEHYINLGYLPPHPAAIQAFMDNPFGGAALWPTSLDVAQTPLGRRVREFGDIDLVVTVSGDQDHVRWWVEQVGSQRQVNIVAGVSASIAPYVQPYYAEKGRGQIKGMLVGLASVPQYEQLTGTKVSPSSWESYVVLANAQLLLVVVIILGAASSLLRRSPGKVPRKESRKPRRRRTRAEAPDGGDE